VALAALLKLTDRGLIGPKDRVVVVSTANGLKFIDFKVGYHAQTLPEVAPKLANKLVELPGDVDSVVKAIGHPQPS
jgi:threonine synthase